MGGSKRGDSTYNMDIIAGALNPLPERKMCNLFIRKFGVIFCPCSPICADVRNVNPREKLTSDLLEALGALHVECAVQVELVVELPDLVVLPRRLRPGKAAKRTEERE